MDIKHPSTCNETFFQWLKTTKNAKVLEIGTMRSNPNIATHHGKYLPKDAIHVKSDAFNGIDVDIVSDAENLKEFDSETFDAIICISTLEHISRPWKAIEQFYRVLKPSGHVLVESHQSFPLHGYPQDYFRFSTDAYNVMGQDVGFEIVDFGYSYPAVITPPKEITIWNTLAPVFLNSSVVYKKSA